MKITKLETTIVTVPFTRPEIWARGARPCVTNVILELTTDNGITGLGEAGGGEEAAASIEAMRPYLMGFDPYDLEILNQRWCYYRARPPPGYAAVETAMLDIQGRATGQPVYKLLGGAVRRSVPYMYYLLRDKPDVMAEEARKAVDAGFETIYIKVGIDIKQDLEAIKAIRGAIGYTPKLRIDPNETWTVGTTARLSRQLQEFDLELLEDPVPHIDLAGMRRLRSSLNIPIAAQESCITLPDIFSVLANEAADIILIDHWRNGGLTGMKKAAAMVEAAGMPVYKHSGGELGISTAANLHGLSTVRNNLLANQTYYQFLGGDVITEPVSFEKGCLRVPDSPGLGVSLDREKLRRYHEVYQRREVLDKSYRSDDLSKEVSEEYYYYPRF